VPLFTAGATDLASLVLEGDSNWFDDFQVVSASPENLDYTGWEQTFELNLGKLEDEDGDGSINLLEFGLGGNPKNGADRGTQPALQVDGQTVRLVHPWRKGALYRILISENLLPDSWREAEWIQTGFSPMTNDYGTVTNQLDEPFTETLFIKLRVGL
jgi:hypothetical protein